MQTSLIIITGQNKVKWIVHNITQMGSKIYSNSRIKQKRKENQIHSQRNRGKKIGSSKAMNKRIKK